MPYHDVPYTDGVDVCVCVCVGVDAEGSNDAEGLVASVRAVKL